MPSPRGVNTPSRKAIFFAKITSMLRICCTCVTRGASAYPGDIYFIFLVLPTSPATDTTLAASLFRMSEAETEQFYTHELVMPIVAALVMCPRRCINCSALCICLTSRDVYLRRFSPMLTTSEKYRV